MQTLNETPFAVDTVLWEDLQGRAKLTVIVKATFEIRKGKAAPRAEQIPIFTADQHYRDDPGAPVRFESDRVPFKPRGDVVLVGCAHAPGARPVPHLDVGLRVGTLSKLIRVFGDRRWRLSGLLTGGPAISPPEPFVTMDLTYERAFGGIDSAAARHCPENTAGKGFVGNDSQESIEGKALPNLEDPRHLIRTWEDRPGPAGFGFYGRGWLPRLRYAGTYDEKYRKERAPALPSDFSCALFNGAHPDLQSEGYLRGDEPVELTNLSSEPRLRFNLPGLIPKVTVRKWTVDPEQWIEERAREGLPAVLDDVPALEEPLTLHLDTLVLTPDDGCFYEVFRGVCPLAGLDILEVSQIKVTT